MSKECISIKELDNLLEQRDKNRLINYVEEAINRLEKMESNNETLAQTIIRGLDINTSKNLIDNDGEDTYSVSVVLDEIKLINFHKVDGWRREDCLFRCKKDDENELLAKGVVLNFLLRACGKVGIEIASDININEIKELKLDDALNSEGVTHLEARIEILAARLLIPQKEFNNSLGREIANLYYEHNKGKKELLSVELLRNIFIARLQSYGVSKRVAEVRLKNARFNQDSIYGYSPDADASLDDFTRRYYDDNNKNELQKKIG